MVMYASKHQRLSDGFHDKNEAHAYEMDKYPHKSRENSGSDSRDRRNRERSVKESPRGVHSESPRNNSEKPYSSKSRSKVYSSSSRPGNNQLPPKSNSCTSSSTPEPERELKELLARANEWTMHTSSSGKKYYYNCKTEVSQWEKPKEWIKKEALEKVIGGKLPVSGSHTNIKTTPSKDRGIDKHSISSRSSQSSQSQPYRSQDRTSSSSASQSESRTRQSSLSGHSSSQKRYTNSQSSSHSSRVNHTSGGQSEKSRSSSHHQSSSSSLRPGEHRNSFYEEENRRGGEGVSSRLGAATAATDNNDSHHQYNQLSPSLHPRLVAGNGANGPGHPLEGPESSRSFLQAPSVATDMYGRLKNLVSPGGTSIKRRDKNDSPKVNNTPSPHISTVSPLPTTSPKTRTPIENRQHGWRKSSSSSPVGRNHSDIKEETLQKFSNPSPMSVASVSDLSSYPSPESSTSTPLSNFASSQHVVDRKLAESMEFSETKDVEPPDKDMDIVDSPTNEEINLKENQESIRLANDGPAKVVTPAVHVDQAADLAPTEAKPKEEELQFENVVFSAESHSSYFCEDLIKDKINTPVEQLEKQAQLVQRDYYRLGFENYSQVMMDLKFARSLVRTTEIQANVQASRIVFLRQQVKELEKLKNENAYMT